jgi:hypothetical protein
VLKATDHFKLQTVGKPVEIGLRSPGQDPAGAAGSDGDFAELLVYDRALDNAESKQVENYLKSKWLVNLVLSDKSPLVWCNPQMSGMTGFTYSKEAGQFLLEKTENKRDSLWRFDPQTSGTVKIAEAEIIKNGQWIGTNGCACLMFTAGTNEVMLADVSGRNKTMPCGQRDFRSSDGGKLVIMGTFSKEPAMGIWEYDTALSRLRPLISGSDHPSAHARNIAPFHGTFKVPPGRNENWTIYPPLNVNPHKKYPLLIGDTLMLPMDNGVVQRQPWMGALANCGAYVVIVNRATWMGGIENWGGECHGRLQDCGAKRAD